MVKRLNSCKVSFSKPSKQQDSLISDRLALDKTVFHLSYSTIFTRIWFLFYMLFLKLFMLIKFDNYLVWREGGSASYFSSLHYSVISLCSAVHYQRHRRLEVLFFSYYKDLCCTIDTRTNQSTTIMSCRHSVRITTHSSGWYKNNWSSVVLAETSELLLQQTCLISVASTESFSIELKTENM